MPTQSGFTGRETATKLITKHKHDNHQIVLYHGTPVVYYRPANNIVTLNSGGWSTATTKRRMNQAAAHWGLKFRVYQTKHTWYVESRGRVAKFYDGITFAA